MRQRHQGRRRFLREGVWAQAHPDSRRRDRLELLHEHGEVNLALLQYKSEVGSGMPKGFVGIHHFGFQCDDLSAQQKKVEQAGAEFFFDLGEPEDGGLERKFKDPNGIVFDLNWKGWQLTRGKIKNAVGGLRPAKSAPARNKSATARKKIAAAPKKRSKRSPVRAQRNAAARQTARVKRSK